MYDMNNVQFQQVWNTRKVHETLTLCKQGMYVGGSSALKGFLHVCLQLRKQLPNFD